MQIGDRSIKLGPKMPKTGHLGPKSYDCAMQIGDRGTKLGPKMPKLGQLGPKSYD